MGSGLFKNDVTICLQIIYIYIYIYYQSKVFGHPKNFFIFHPKSAIFNETSSTVILSIILNTSLPELH